jgi:hypothetical protein
MPRRSDVFETGSIRVPHFGSGEVAQIVGLDLWELNRYLSRYSLTSSGQLGQGRGSRRWYNPEDVFRIATSIFLIKDGFAPKLVAEAVQKLEDEDFYGSHDQRGEFSEFGISFRRTDSGPEVHIYRADKPPELKMGSKTYYAIDLSAITKLVNQRIALLQKSEKKEK